MSSRLPRLSPGAYLRLLSRPGPEHPATPATVVDCVIVTPGTGDSVVRVTARFADGTRPLCVEVDRSLLTDQELASLIAWARRFAERRDPQRKLKSL